ncbi:hypothetical protein POTOM_000059 [Populus tomentosa]|uniref:Uncharacterized protein n=1 Tax=Populus tomentosa TaxID=118781 RepID=A0A8X8AMB7_POPTO|nr:hypothetical protein POTOM_000059 [Populus tomentosa]
MVHFRLHAGVLFFIVVVLFPLLCSEIRSIPSREGNSGAVEVLNGFLPLEPIPNHSFNPHPNQSPLSRSLPSSIGKGSKSTTGPGDCLCDDFFLIEFRLLSFFHRSAFFFFSSFRLASFESVTACCPRVHPCSTSGCWASPALMAAGSRSRSATQVRVFLSLSDLSHFGSVGAAVWWPLLEEASELKEMKRSGKMGVDVAVDPCFWRKEIDGDADLLCCLCSLLHRSNSASCYSSLLDYDNFTRRAYVGRTKKLLTLPLAYTKAQSMSSLILQ